MPDSPTFAGLPAVLLDDLAGKRAVVFGASEATPYVRGEPSHAADGPAAIRSASRQFARQLGQLDFDLGFTLLPDKQDFRGLADAGDVSTRADTPDENRAAIAATTRRILDAGAVPILIGGDDSVPIPFLSAFAGRGPFTVVQIDAHLDWGDAIRGEPLGYGSPMRRASEMPHIISMVQIGIRGLGSGGAWQTAEARAWGTRVVTMRGFRAAGVDAALDRIDPENPVIVSIDCDGLDPGVFPAVAMPTPGGLGYDDVIAILHGVANRSRIAGLFLGEYVPDRDDARRLSALTAARLVSVALGLVIGPGEETLARPLQKG